MIPSTPPTQQLLPTVDADGNPGAPLSAWVCADGKVFFGDGEDPARHHAGLRAKRHPRSRKPVAVVDPNEEIT